MLLGDGSARFMSENIDYITYCLTSFIKDGRVKVELAVALVGTSVASAAANFTWTAKGAVPKIGQEGSADAISCPSATLCVVGGGNGVAVTTSIQAKAKTWKYARIGEVDPSLGQAYITDVKCPVPGLCVAVDDHSNAYVSPNPTGGVQAWLPGPLPSGTYVGIEALSCPSPTLCAALDVAGNGLTTASPGGSWTTTQVTPQLNVDLYELGCAETLCVGVESDSNVYVTADPASQPATWTATSIGANSLSTVACASAKLCIAAESFKGALYVSTNPAGGKAAWKKITIKGLSGVDHLRCPSASLCLATSNTSVWWSTTPTKASSWKQSTLPGAKVILSDVSCPTPRLCAAIDVGGKVWVGSR